MTLYAASNMHRVLGIPELLDMVFRFMDTASNAKNACVCKQWSEISLDFLWRDVDDLYRLFSLLAPLRETGDGIYEFRRLPESSDWRRFEKYSRRVRRLRFPSKEPEHILHQTVFDDVARTRTSLNILPNTHTLEWNQSLALCVMFMHGNVKRFIVQLPDELAETSPRPFFQDIVARMPNLTLVDLRMNISMRSIEKEVVALFCGLLKLQKVVLPRFTLTSRITETLSRSVDLEVIEFQYNEEQGCGDPTDVEVFSPSLEEGAFPSLWDLSLTVRFEHAAQFLNVTFAPTNITLLYIDSPIPESPSDVHKILNIVAENCQLLKSLTLAPLVRVTGVHSHPSSDERINIETLRPILSCANLISFELFHRYPLDLHAEDIEMIASKWPSLETLTLNNEPLIFDQSTLTLGALLPFARHCPRLQSLGLFIHASTADLLSSYQSGLPSSYSTSPFQKLRKLSLGVSIISEEGPVALFLSQICPLGCRLECGVTWEGVFDDEMDALRTEQIKIQCEKWEKVGELLPLLTKLRIEERERTRALQSEVEDLRTRTDILMGRAAMSGEDACVVF